MILDNIHFLALTKDKAMWCGFEEPISVIDSQAIACTCDTCLQLEPLVLILSIPKRDLVSDLPLYHFGIVDSEIVDEHL